MALHCIVHRDDLLKAVGAQLNITGKKRKYGHSQ